MRKSTVTFIVIFLSIISINTFAKTVEVLMFEYPPLQGLSKTSDIGLVPEVIKAAFKEENVDVAFKILPTQRVINDIKTGKGLLMIGLKEYFDKDVQDTLTTYPTLHIDFLFFYKKKDFIEGFSYKNLNDLKKYSISVLLNGVTHVFAKNNNINVEGVISVDSIFKKISSGRTKLGVSEYLSGLNSIDKLYPEEKNQWACYKEKPFFSTDSLAIFSKNNPDYKIYNKLFSKGLVKIVNNGKWEKIAKKYFPNNVVDNESINLMKEFAKKNSKTDK